jgi:predicted transglutaminase-like cysteine proteinase
MLFGKVSVPFGNEGWMEKWRKVRDAADGGLLQSRCAGTALCRKKRVAQIRENIDAAWQMTPLQRLAVANRVINQVLTYKEDDPFTDDGDHWQTFRETIERGTGDCEDFAIAKMEMLAAMGMPADKMTLVVVKDTAKDRHHAVLVVDIAGSNLVLDVEDDKITGDAQDINYDPMFSFNRDAMRVYGNRIADAPQVRPAA